MPKTFVPAYRHHKASGQAFVQVKGRRFYLGRHGTHQSQERYARFIAEQAVRRATTPQTTPGVTHEITVVERSAAYWDFARGYYIKGGQPTGHIHMVRRAIQILRELYGHVPATQFGPLAMRAMQQKLVQTGRARSYINCLCAVVRRMFKWGASQELFPSAIHQALTTVPGLKKGRTEAGETEPVRPVTDDVVDATLPHLPKVVADMVRLQRLTGCRPGEVCSLRPCDVDRSGEVWAYRPASHKTEHHGRERVIFIGPKAQEVLLPYLLREAEACCFSPVESEAKRKIKMRARRKTRIQPSQVNRRKRHPKRQPRDHYTKDSYGRAISRAIEKANKDRPKEERIPYWHLNQLRHTAATEVRRQFGLEAAQAVLGHAKADVTQVYAERDMALAADIMRRIG